jgi:hypothetical protein
MSLKLKYLFILVLSFGFLLQVNIYAQIDDIKKKSDENKENRKNNNNDNSGNDSGGGCLESIGSECFSGAVEIGCNIFSSIIGEYTSHVYAYKETDPSIFSIDVNLGFAPGIHFSNDTNFHYMNYLPGIRANLASFMIDFRFNLLTEYENNLPNSFRSWDLIVGFNIVPSDKFKITIGTGVQREMYDDMYFHEYYLGSKIWLLQLRDYLELDYRCSADYETGILPFQEAGAKYNLRIFNMENVSAHITLGAIYQNYYQSHEIWALKTGLILNFH